MSENSVYSVISKLRTRIKETSDDSVFSDEFLYSMLLDNRNLIIQRQIDKKKDISPFLYKILCVPLCKKDGDLCDCDCDIFGNEILRSKFKIPTAFQDCFEVLSSDLSTKYDTFKPNQLKYQKYRRTNKTFPIWNIVNEYLEVRNSPNNKLRRVLINAIWFDPSSLADVPNECDEETGSTTCYDVYTDTFQVSGDLVGVIIDMTMQQLMPTLGVKTDQTNNANAENADEPINQ